MGPTFIKNDHMSCTKHFIIMTSTTSIVENLHATDYLNDVVFFNIFLWSKLLCSKEKKKTL